jgi:hypothetical protein
MNVTTSFLQTLQRVMGATTTRLVKCRLEKLNGSNGLFTMDRTSFPFFGSLLNLIHYHNAKVFA